MVDAGKAAVGAANEQDLITKLKDDPAAALAVQAAVREIWYEITYDTSGIEGARKADVAYLAPDSKGFWHSPAFWVSLLLLAMPLSLVADFLFVHPTEYGDNIRTQIVTALLSIITVIAGYWIGTSASSQRKTELAAQRP